MFCIYFAFRSQVVGVHINHSIPTVTDTSPAHLHHMQEGQVSQYNIISVLIIYKLYREAATNIALIALNQLVTTGHSTQYSLTNGMNYNRTKVNISEV